MDQKNYFKYNRIFYKFIWIYNFKIAKKNIDAELFCTSTIKLIFVILGLNIW